MFGDVMLNIMSVTTDAPSDEEVASGATPEVIVTLTPGLMLPLADPNNPMQPIIVPVGNLRFRVDADGAVAIGRKLLEEGERLPKRSRIEVATNLAGAEQAAQRLNQLRR